MSRFLALCNGIIRLEVTHEWAVHRALPSARCLYPNDIYIVIPEHSFSQFPPGIYYYNPLQHCLIQVRSGDYQDEIVRQLIEQPVTKPDFIIGCASNFARTAYKYADFAYRLCTQEAGMMQGHVLQLAGEYGLEGRFHYHFVMNLFINCSESAASMKVSCPWLLLRIRRAGRQESVNVPCRKLNGYFRGRSRTRACISIGNGSANLLR